MCGIIGALDYAGNLPAPEAFLKCLEKLQRRGPDDSGIWADQLVRLGHRRLAIVDLSATGHQPMVSADGRHVIVFNGEIYNHQELRRELEQRGRRFRSHSDTETVLNAFLEWEIGRAHV